MNDNTPPTVNDPRSQVAYTRQEVADLFGVTVNTVTNWLNEGRLRRESGEPVAWQEKTGRREWYIVAEAVHRLRDAIRLVEGKDTAVTIHELEDVTIYTVTSTTATDGA